MKRAGYEPQARHTAARAVEIKFDLTHKIGKKTENGNLQHCNTES